jgi:hypothetical protein
LISLLASSIVFKRNASSASGTRLLSTLQPTRQTIKSTVCFSPCMTKTTKAHESRESSKQASKRARIEKRTPSIPFHCIKFIRSLSTDDGEMTINPDNERVIDNCGADERSWPSNLEMRWGIWLGDGKIWFLGKQKTTVITEQAGCGVDVGSLYR